jgi:hypothetical protein|tara:strand:- start:1567 stop:1818 length:252 start_codon:yes stop_codon:yes gene_type:complete
MSQRSNDIIQEYGIDFIARFACLYEGVNVACSRAERIGYNTEKSNAWIKPTAFQKYIDERYLDMKYEIQQYQKGVNTDEIYPW